MTFSFAFSNRTIILVGFVRIFDIGIFGFVSFLGFGFIFTLLFFVDKLAFSSYLYGGVFLTNSWTALVSVRSYFYTRITLPPPGEPGVLFLV